MKAILFVSSLCALGLFACAAPTEDPQDQPEPAAIEKTGEVSTKMISQGGCTPEQLAWGGYDDGWGDCIIGGGGGGSNPNPTACFNRCGGAEDRCELRCKTEVCIINCLNAERRCESGCY